MSGGDFRRWHLGHFVVACTYILLAYHVKRKTAKRGGIGEEHAIWRARRRMNIRRCTGEHNLKHKFPILILYVLQRYGHTRWRTRTSQKDIIIEAFSTAVKNSTRLFPLLLLLLLLHPCWLSCVLENDNNKNQSLCTICCQFRVHNLQLCQRAHERHHMAQIACSATI